MTTIAPTQLWSSMPGWGIAADLTPPELTNSRQLSVLRKWLGVGLIALLVVLAGAYVLVAGQNASAAHTLARVQSKTSQLQGDTHKYIGVTQIQGTVAQVQSQIALLMADDVDLVTLMDRVRTALPTTMEIGSEAITISPAGVAAATTSELNTTGLAQIGDVKISGNGIALDDLSNYVDALRLLPGVVDVVPTSNTEDAHGMQYSLTFGLTSALISHRFDPTTTRSK